MGQRSWRLFWALLCCGLIGLFSLDSCPLQDYLPLTRCAEDLLHLKSTWDTIAAVLYTFADW